MTLPWINCHLYRPDKISRFDIKQQNQYLFLAYFNQGATFEAVYSILESYISAFDADSATSLALYLPNGDDLADQLIEKVSEREGLPDIQLLLEAVEESENPDLLASADCLICPENNQIQQVMQALAMNRPVLAATSLGLSEVLQDKVQGIFNLAEPEQLCKLFKSLFLNQPRPTTRGWVLKTGIKESGPKQWDAVFLPSMRHARQFADSTRNRLWITDDVVTAAFLQEEGLSHLIIQDFVADAKEQEDIFEQSSLYCESWHQPFYDGVTYGNLPLAKICQYDMWYAFRGCMTVAEAYKRILAEYSLNSLSMANELRQAQYWDPAFGPFPDPHHAVLRYLSEKQQVPVHLLTPPPAGWIQARPGTQIPDVPIRPETLFTDPAAFKRIRREYDHVVLGLGSDIDIKELGVVSDWLWNHEKVLFLYFRKYLFPVSQPNALFFDLNLLLKWPENQAQLALPAQLTQAWAAYQRAVTPEKNRYPEIFDNPHLTFQFEHFSTQIQDSVKYMRCADLLADYFEPDLCLTGMGASGTFRAMLSELRQKQVPVVSIFHGSTDRKEFHAPADLTMVSGHREKKRMESAGYAYPLGVLGDMRLLSEFKSKPEALAQLSSINAKAKSRPIVMLIAAQISYGSVTQVADVHTHLEDWEQIRQYIASRPDVYFVVKTHPRYDHFEYYYTLEKQLENLEVADYQLKYAELARITELVVFVNCFSTVMYEVCESKKPLITLTHAFLPQSYQHHNRLDYPMGKEVNSVDTLFEVISDFLKDPASAAETLELEAKILQHEKSYSQSESTENFKGVIEQQLSHQPARSRTLTEDKLTLLSLLTAYESAQVFQNPTIWQQAVASTAALPLAEEGPLSAESQEFYQRVR